MEQMTKNIKKIIQFGGVPIGTLGAGIGIGSLYKGLTFKRAIDNYNKEENNAIANQYYMQGFSDALSKTSSLSPSIQNTLYGTGLIGLGAGGFLFGKKLQVKKNKGFAHAFNEYNKQENEFIEREAYNKGFQDALKEASMKKEANFSDVLYKFYEKPIAGVVQKVVGAPNISNVSDTALRLGFVTPPALLTGALIFGTKTLKAKRLAKANRIRKIKNALLATAGLGGAGVGGTIMWSKENNK
jgi:hypothetical protein